MSKEKMSIGQMKKMGYCIVLNNSRYYQAEFGCQLCFLEKRKNAKNDNIKHIKMKANEL
jgi:hypothetical protein